MKKTLISLAAGLSMLALPALQAWYADARAESEVIAQAEPYRQG